MLAWFLPKTEFISFRKPMPLLIFKNTSEDFWLVIYSTDFAQNTFITLKLIWSQKSKLFTVSGKQNNWYIKLDSFGQL